MSRLNNAIHEVNRIDETAAKDQWINNIHPLVKLILTFIYIIFVVSVNEYRLDSLIAMAVYPAAVFILWELSLKECLKRLRFVLPIVFIVGIFNPLFDRSPYAIFYGITITTGMISMVSLIIKGMLSVIASYILIATTTIEKICYALRLLHVPSVIVTQIMLMYRYILLLLNEAHRITQAYELRAPGQKGIHFKVWGSLLGQLLLRSIDRSQVIYESMCLRGYTGEFKYYNKAKVGASDVRYFIIWLALILVLRFVPVIKMAGSLF